MSNYGMNIGNGNNFSGQTNIKNKTFIRKGHITISIAVGIVLIVIAIFALTHFHKESIVGRWIDDNGESIEFLSDGTIHENGYDDLYADTYEIMEEGYLKWGKYSAGWMDYEYTYWDIDLKGNHMTLTQRDHSNRVISLTKE